MIRIFETPNELIEAVRSCKKVCAMTVKCVGCMRAVIHDPEGMELLWDVRDGVLSVQYGKDRVSRFPVRMIEEISVKYRDYGEYKRTERFRISGVYTQELLSEESLMCLRKFGL